MDRNFLACFVCEMLCREIGLALVYSTPTAPASNKVCSVLRCTALLTSVQQRSQTRLLKIAKGPGFCACSGKRKPHIYIGACRGSAMSTGTPKNHTLVSCQLSTSAS